MDAGQAAAPAVLEVADLEALVGVLRTRGWTVVGPQLRDGAIVYDTLESAADLPAGWTDEQAPASYRLKRRDDKARFGHRPGPTAWKRFLFPTDEPLWRATRDPKGVTFETLREAPRHALLGVRACELRAIAIQDRVLLGGPFTDPVYRERRERAFVVAVACGESGGTCFCASMGAGPELGPGWDLALSELTAGGPHRFVLEAATGAGREVLEALGAPAASEADRAAARALPAAARAGQRREVDTAGLAERLAASPEHPEWDAVAARCLACGSCTLACPTCFCHTLDEDTDLANATAVRTRRWDSCFTQEFTYIHGGSVRQSVRSRYRQWLTHKFSTWHRQFGSAGCVGCGRCITWCPAGIDVTEEVRAIQHDRKGKERHAHA